MKPKTIVLTTCGQKDPNVIFGKSGDVNLVVLAESQLWELHLPPLGFPLPSVYSAPFLFQLDKSFVLYFYSRTTNLWGVPLANAAF